MAKTDTVKALDVVLAMDAEIKRREDDLTKLREARAVLAGSVTVTHQPSPLTLPAPRKKRRAKAKGGEDGEGPSSFELKGKVFEFSYRGCKVFDALIEAPGDDYVSMQSLIDACGGPHVSTIFAALREIKDAIASVKVTVGNARGQGYRLEDLE